MKNKGEEGKKRSNYIITYGGKRSVKTNSSETVKRRDMNPRNYRDLYFGFSFRSFNCNEQEKKNKEKEKCQILVLVLAFAAFYV